MSSKPYTLFLVLFAKRLDKPTYTVVRAGLFYGAVFCYIHLLRGFHFIFINPLFIV